MTRPRTWLSRSCRAAVLAAAVALTVRSSAQEPVAPEMLDPTLGVRTVVGGLNLPIAIAFIAPNDLLVLAKDTGRVKRVVNGVVTATVLDLGVNRNSERGLLGIALHPDFPRNRGVYLYWTCRSSRPPSDPFFP